jgi:hypothetical protein
MEKSDFGVGGCQAAIEGIEAGFCSVARLPYWMSMLIGSHLNPTPGIDRGKYRYWNHVPNGN